MILEQYVTSNQRQFVSKVKNIACKLNTWPEYLMAVMYFESRLNHRAQNPLSTATGLIQFLQSTAVGLGTTTNRLLQMSNVEQLDYVHEYLKPYKGQLNSLEDVYLAVFYPAAIGKPDDYVIGNAETARVNPALNVNNDNQLTVGEVRKSLNAKLPATALETLKKKNK